MDGKRMFFTEKMLIVSPHADDEMFGVGGTLLKNKCKKNVLLLLVTAGDVTFSSMDRFVSREQRISEFRKSAQILTGNDAVILAYPKEICDERKLESRLDSIPIREVISRIDGVVDDFKPDTIVFPEPSHHQDHKVVFNSCIAVMRNSAKHCIRTGIMYEEPGANWGMNRSFTPNLFVDIEDTIKEKIRLFKEIYPSQFKEGRCSYSEEGIKRYASYRGMEVGYKFCEAFQILRHCI